jgi:hypothetical protein
MSMKRFWKWYYVVPAVIVLAPVAIALFVFVSGGIVMLLWNWLLPPLFGVPEVTLLQGFGLLVLGRLLFGGWGGGGGGGGGGRHMSKEDRERMRERFCEKPSARDTVIEGEATRT